MDWDLFLSYSTEDDGAPAQWVRKLHEELLARMRVIQPTLVPRTWIDFQQLRGDERIHESIKTALEATGVLVCVASENYILAPYCEEELRLFCRARRRGEPKIVKIAKLPVDDLALWNPLASMRGFDFHNGADPPMELAYGSRDKAINDLAWRLVQLIKLARSDPKGRIWILAGPDRQPISERTTNEVLLREYDVLPSTVTGRISDAELEESGSRADLSILIFGTQYSPNLDAAFTLLTDKLRGSKLKRCLLSIPNEPVTDPRQLALLERVRETPMGFDRIDEMPAVDFWRQVMPHLKAIEDSKRKPTVYLKYQRDLQAQLNPVRLQIPQERFEVLDPFKEGQFGPSVQTDAFERAHGILVYAAQQADQLLLRMGKDLQRARKKVVGVYPASSDVELASGVLQELQFPLIVPDPLDESSPLGRSIARFARERRISFPGFLERVDQNARAV